MKSTVDRRATYRLQLRPEFDLDAAVGVIDYLHDLGISHVYPSPLLQAVPGSTHGYDVVDPSRISLDLGGEAALQRLVEALHARGMGLLVDIVPNHIATSDPGNVWWYDVLEDGRMSPFADFFDIDWDTDHPLLRHRVLVPILAHQVSRVLDSGDLSLVRQGGLFIRYFDQRLPLNPGSVSTLLSMCGVVALRDVASAINELPDADPVDVGGRTRRRDRRIATGELVAAATALHAEVIDTVLARISADPVAIDDILGVQHYRLAHWRSASAEVNYRRFFDISTLVGLREEDPRVFTSVHGRCLELIASGVADGVRVDHVDGLRSPTAYVEKLRAAAGDDCWIIVEKILAPGEILPRWPIDGTTGYEFAGDVLGLFVDPAGEAALTDLYHDASGAAGDARDVVISSKAEVLRGLLAADLQRLVRLLETVCAGHPDLAGYSRADMEDVIVAFIATLPVYRTYVDSRGASAADVATISRTRADVIEREPRLDTPLLDLLVAVVSGDRDGAAAVELSRRLAQVSASAAAKGMEDTAFYRHVRLLALNEVGGDPGRFGVDIDAFHAARTVATAWPDSLLATSTHDTKRSEDVRARLAVLSELPYAWTRAVHEWRRLLGRAGVGGAGHWAMEYIFFQTLVGAFPLEADRAVEYMRKAAREAKLETSWLRPDADYENALEEFVRGALVDVAFTQAVATFAEPLVRWGRINSLAQTLIKLTAPGVPDIYQGCEVWDLSLVDPDNRRPVDFHVRRGLLARAGNANGKTAMSAADSGLPKLLVIVRALELRTRRANVFAGGYAPLVCGGDLAAHAVAYTRGGGAIAVVVPRLVTRLDGGWGDTTVTLPEGRWRDVINRTDLAGGSLPLAGLLNSFPVALLERVG